MGVSYRPMNTRSNWPLPVDTSVVTRWRKTFSSTTTQFNLMSRFAASNLGESFLSSIIAGLLTVAMVTVFCSAMALAPLNRAVTKIARCLFIVLGGYRLVYLSWRLAVSYNIAALTSKLANCLITDENTAHKILGE